MKKFTILLSILLCLSFNIIRVTPLAAATSFKEGVYNAVDFNFTPNNEYKIQNISPDSNVYVLLFDENQLAIQTFRLDPNSGSYNLLPLKPSYRIVIVGNGEVSIS